MFCATAPLDLLSPPLHDELDDDELSAVRHRLFAVPYGGAPANGNYLTSAHVTEPIMVEAGCNTLFILGSFHGFDSKAIIVPLPSTSLAFVPHGFSVLLDMPAILPLTPGDIVTPSGDRGQHATPLITLSEIVRGLGVPFAVGSYSTTSEPTPWACRWRVRLKTMRQAHALYR